MPAGISLAPYEFDSDDDDFNWRYGQNQDRIKTTEASRTGGRNEDESKGVSGREDESGKEDVLFDNSLTTNVTAQLGNKAVLECRVHNVDRSNPVRF